MATCKSPSKPRKDFPLFPHRNGQWAKKIKNRMWYFGKWDDPDAALQTYLDQRDDIHAGRDPKRQTGVATPDSISVADVVNHYLTEMNGRREGGEIGNQHFRDCRASGKVVVEHFGRRVGASSLKAADFTALRESFPATWGPGKTGAEIGRIRSIFKWAFESELIPAVPNYGPRFKKPPKAEARKSLAKRVATVGRMSFEADEIRRLLENSTGWLHACILLGINCGFGNKDCGQLRVDHIDFQTGWYDLPRQKTGIDRQCILWQRTLDAIETAKSDRSTPKMSGDDSLCFLTSHGRPVFWESLNEANRSMSRCDNVGKAFTKVVKDCGIRTGRGFYSLRRTFETVAGNSKDQVAVNMVMGHTDESMAEVYRQGIDDKRLKDVAKHVEKWLFGKAK